MSKTILQIGNEAAALCNLPQQTALFGNSDQNAVRILQAVKDAAEKDVFRGNKNGWEILQSDHSFATDGSSSYDEIPADFDRIVQGTLWDQTNYRPIIGPVSQTTWQKYNSGLQGVSGLYLLFRIVGDGAGGKVIKIYPSTDDGTTVAFEYVSKYYVLDADGVTPKADMETDADTVLFDDDLVVAAATWRLLRSLGMSFADEKIEFDALLDERMSSQSVGESLCIQLGSTWSYYDPNVPQTGYGS